MHQVSTRAQIQIGAQMPTQNASALEFLLTRRSRPYKTLTAPWPDREALGPLLTAAVRSPDHGKLEPWRFLVIEGPAHERLAQKVEEHGPSVGRDADATAKMAAQFRASGLTVAVIASPKPSEKIPEFEQILSAGAVCLQLLNAALASGWGANWLSGWASHDRTFVERYLSLAPHEQVAGLIHIGTQTATPPERPRPDPALITQWISA